MKKFFFTITQFILLIDISKQSQIKQGVVAIKTFCKTLKKPLIKTISSPIKESLNKIQRSKNTIKNLAYGLEEKYLGSEPVKYLVEEGIKAFKYRVPQAAGEGSQYIRTSSKTSNQIGTTFNMGRRGQTKTGKQASKFMEVQNMRKMADQYSKGNIKKAQKESMKTNKYTSWLLKRGWLKEEELAAYVKKSTSGKAMRAQLNQSYLSRYRTMILMPAKEMFIRRAKLINAKVKSLWQTVFNKGAKNVSKQSNYKPKETLNFYNTKRRK